MAGVSVARRNTNSVWHLCLWLMAFAVLCTLAAQPVGLQAQIVLGVTGIAFMLTINILKISGAGRHIFLAIGALLIFRYIWWRATSTLPPVTEPANFIPGVMLFAAELYSVLMLAINFFIISDPIERPVEDLPEDKSLWPSVDVFVPSYNEDAQLLAATLAAAKNMDYPSDKFEVFLLDDGGTDQKRNQKDGIKSREAMLRHTELKELCSKLGVTYMTRARNESAKAGNLNAAFHRTRRNLILVLDADHAPVQDFLIKTAGYFLKDPKLFLVQTPHSFINPDPLERNLNTFERMPSENEMFYSMVQKGLDKWNASFFCGSAALLSRHALEETNGFSGDSITEDCETALELHAKGWNSAYLDQPLIAGLQPETFSSFIGQRSRWCQGMLQIFLLKRPFIKPGLTFAQRIGYLSSGLFWLFPCVRLTFMLAPVLYILFDLEIFEASVQEFIAFTTFFMIANILMQNYLYGRLRWPWISELYEYIQSLHLFGAIFSVIRNPRAPSFNVTAKGETIEKTHLSNLSMPFFYMYLLMLATTIVAIWRLWNEPAVNELLSVVTIWSVFNLIICSVALGVMVERPERRKSSRLPAIRNGLLQVGNHRLQAQIEDCSISGLKIRPRNGVLPLEDLGDEPLKIAFGMHKGKPKIASLSFKITWQGSDENGPVYGGNFVELAAEDFAAIADLIYPTASRFDAMRKMRRQGKSISFGTIVFIWWGLVHSSRAIWLLLKTKIILKRKAKSGWSKPDVEELYVPVAPLGKEKHHA